MRYSVQKDDFSNVHAATNDVWGELHWRAGFVGSGSVAQIASESGAPGIIRLTTGSTTNDSTYIQRAQYLPADVSHFTVRLRCPTSTSHVARFGLGFDPSAAAFGASGIFFQRDTVVGAPVHAITRSAATSTDVDTLVSLSTSAFLGWQFVRASASLWHAFTISTSGARTYASSHTTNIPTSVLYVAASIQTLTNAARSLDVDFIEVRSNRLAR